MNFSTAWLPFSILLLVSASFIQSSGEVTILDGPHSVNTTLNSTANFTCLVSGGAGVISGIIWFINGTAVEHHPPLIAVGDNTFSYFEVEALLARNGSSISFLVLTTTIQVVSANALLLIQGVLDPPSWSSVSFTGNNLTLQWSHPHTLYPIPIMGYRVTVQSSTVIISDNTTTSLTMDQVGGSNCSNVVASIAALNSIGYSEVNSYSILHPGDINVTNILESLQYTDGSNNKLLTLQMNASVHFNCHEVIPLSATLNVKSLHDNPAVSLYTITSNTTLYNDTSSALIRSSAIDNIEHNGYYTVDMTMYYEGGHDVIENIIQISSFDTQAIETGKSTSNNLCVRCQFLPGSSVEGCLVHVSGNPNDFFDAQSSLSEWVCFNTSAFINDNNTYAVTVFDKESDLTVNEVISINKHIDSEEFNTLPIVVDDTPIVATTTVVTTITSSTPSNTIGTTNSVVDHSSTSSQDVITTTIRGASPSLTSVTSTVTNVIPIPTLGGIGEQPTSTSMTLVIVISGVGVVFVLLILVIVAGLIGCFVLTQQRRKVMQDRQRHNGNQEEMFMSMNTVYGSDIAKSMTNGTGEMHIYSEIGDVMKTSNYVMASKSNQSYSVIPPLKDNSEKTEKKDQTKQQDDWIPNPTYQLAPFENKPPPTVLINTNTYTDDRADKLSVEACPAYGSSGQVPPRPPGNEEVGGAGKKVVYEDLNHIVQ